MDIGVRTMDGKTHPINSLNPCSKVHDLKVAIKQKLGLRGLEYHLVFEGRTIASNMDVLPLSKFGVKSGSVLSMVPSGIKD